MLDAKTFNAFIKRANHAHQQLSVWFCATNEFAKHQARWNTVLSKPEIVSGCKYKNFWDVVVTTLQHGWILSTARLFDPAHHSRDEKREKPRMSLDYLLIRLDDEQLANAIRKQQKSHQEVIDSLKSHRDNALAHNDVNFAVSRIEPGIENLFQWLEDTIAKIKESRPHLAQSNSINITHNEVLAKCGVDEVFETLLFGEKNEK